MFAAGGVALATPAVAAPADWTVAPGSISFPDRYLTDAPEPVVVTVTNNDTVTKTPLISISTDALGYVTSTNNCTTPIAPGDYCSLSYTTTTALFGSLTGSSTITVDGVANVRPLTAQVLGAFTVVPSGFAALDFPDTPVGSPSAPLAVTITNVADTTRDSTFITTSSVPSSWTKTSSCPSTLAAHARCELNFVFTPTAVGQRLETYTLKQLGGQSFAVNLGGTGVIFTVDQAALAFPDTIVGDTSAALPVTVTNVTGTVRDLGGPAMGVPSGFTSDFNGCTYQLAAGASCTMLFRFAPGSDLPYAGIGTITILGTTYQIPLSGLGVNWYTLQKPPPTTIDTYWFPKTALGVIRQVSATVTNVSTTPRTGQIATSWTFGSPAFKADNQCPTTLEPGSSCTIRFLFAPAVVGTTNATAKITISGNPHLVQLAGDAVAYSQPSATVITSTGNEGERAFVTFTNPVDDNGGAFLYSYDLDNDGIFEISNGTAASADLPAALSANSGDYPVRLRITNQGGVYTNYNATVHVANVAPTAWITGPNSGVAGTPLTFEIGANAGSAAAGVVKSGPRPGSPRLTEPRLGAAAMLASTGQDIPRSAGFGALGLILIGAAGLLIASRRRAASRSRRG